MWLPHAKRVNLGGAVAGGPYDDTRNPKVCWHTTEGSSLAGARAAFAAYPPHLGYDPATRELEQYVPLDRHSYAFFNGEADDEYVIQIEVVGFAARSHLMSDEHVQRIVEDLVDPLEEFVGVPPVVVWHGFHGEGEGLVLATPSSPIRLTLAQLREFAGHLGHQHIPGDGHWDPGRFRIDEVLRRSQEGTVALDNETVNVVRPDTGETWPERADVVLGYLMGTVNMLRDMAVAQGEVLRGIAEADDRVNLTEEQLARLSVNVTADLRAVVEDSVTRLGDQLAAKLGVGRDVVLDALREFYGLAVNPITVQE